MVNTQFKDIGEIAKVLKNVGTDSNSLASNLGDIGIEAAKAALEINNVSENVQRATLVQKYGKEAADAIMNVGDAATKSTSKIDNLGTALVGAFKSHPYLIAGTAIAAIGATAYTVYKNIKQGYIESATEATSVWEESKTSLEDYASKYKELKSQLDSGNLSEAETISVKQQILDIQNQITSAYGESAAGIDLINGKLDTQLAKMQSISQEEAQRNINQNRENYEDAEYEMKKERRYEIGSLSAYNIDSNDDYNKANKAIRDLVKDFESKGLHLEDNGYAVRIVFKGDATQADEVINEFESKVESMKSLYGENNAAIDSVLTSASSSLKDNQKILDNYQENYRAYMEQQLFSKGYGDELLNYGKAIENYNNALLSGDTSKIEEAKQAFQEANIAKEQLLSEDGNSDFGFLFDEFTEKLDTATIKYNDFQEALTSDSLSDDNQFKNQADDISKASDRLKDLKLQAVDVANALSTDGFQKGESSIRKLATAWGLTEENMTPDNIQAFVDVLVQAGIVIGNVASNVSSAGSEVETAYDRVIAKSSTWLATIDNVNAALVNSVSGSGLTATIDEETGTLTGNVTDIINAYKDLDGFDASTLFEETANGIHLNTDALRLLQAQEEANNKTEFLKARKELLQQLAEEQAKLNTITDQSSIEYSSQQSVIDGLQNQIQTVELLSSAYDGATSAYQRWLNAQSSGEEGDMYRNVSETMRERAKTLYDEGRVNTNEFRAIAQFYSNKDLSTASAEQVVKAYEKASGTIKKYFTGDKTGIDAFVADMKKLSDKENLGWVEELKDGSLKFNTGSDEEIAKRLGISKEAIQALYRAMTEYIDGIQIGDTSGEDTLSDQIEKAKEKAKAAQKELQDTMDSMSGENKIDLSFDIDAIDDVDELQAKINELTEYKKTLDVDSDEYQQAQDIIDGCQARIQEINNENAVISVTIDGEDGITSLKEAINSIPEDKSSNITVSVQDSSQIENTVAEIEKIPENKTANFTFNVQNQEDADALSAKIDDLNSKRGDNKITYTVSVVDDTGDSTNNKEAKVNYSLGEQEDPKDKQAKVNYFLGTQAKPNDRFAKVNYSLGTQAQPKPVTVKVNYDTSAKPSGVGGADGTAHVNGTAPKIKSSSFSNGLLGTAHASGDWSLKQDETALTGELGREIVVRNGRFFTIGDNGAEFTKLKKGDIIFNHRQTEDLLSKGYVTGRGKLIGGNAHVEGTAYSNAKGWTIGKTLGNSGSKAYDSQKSKKSKESTSKNTKATDKNTTATNKNTEATENLQDWIEYSTNLQSKENDRLYDAIESFEMHANQNKAIDAYITDSQAYMNTLRNAQNAYMSKANSLGLDAGYIHKIWAGDDISFEDIQDENLRDKISKYQDYYEKAKELGDQMTELNQKIRETKISKLDNIQDDYDNLVSYAEGIIDYNEAVNDLFESRNLVGNQDALMNNINQQMAIRQALVNEQKELTDQLNALVASGDIAEYTDTWLKWKTEINGVTSAIVKADSALEELKQSIMEIRYKSFEDSLNNLDFNSEMFSSIRDLMSQEGIYDDNVKLTDSGKTQLALMEQELISAKQKVANYNTAIEALAKDLAYGNITQAQFNEKLQEYQKDQMSAVKATKDARDAILDLIKDGITKESEAVQELIQKRKDDLSLQKEYYDFQKKMNDKSKEMNKIRAQIAAMEGDNSLETVAKRKKLMSQLQELEEEYNEELNDRKYDIVQDAYDKTNELTKENEEKSLKELETNLNVQNEAIANALEVTKATYQTVYDQLNMLAQQYNFTLTDSLTSPWLNAQSAIDSYQQAIGKVQSNVSIDTSQIQGTTPSQNQTVPTKNEASTQNLDKSANGTWLKQGEQWWYQHAGGGWTNNGWEQIDGKWYKFDQNGWMQSGWQPWGTDSTGQTAWYYMGDPNDGSMKTSTWVQGKDGKQYFVDHSGVMARNGYVKSVNSGMYYWVNGDGVWEPQWNTYNPNLNKYKLYYNSGKKRVPYDALAYIDDTPDHKLDLGSEAIITDKGALVQMDAGDMVFNKAQKEFLYEFSKGQIPAGARSMLPSVNTNFASMKPVNKGDININYGSLLTVNGDIDKEVFPGMQKTCESTFDYFVKNMRKYKNRLN